MEFNSGFKGLISNDKKILTFLTDVRSEVLMALTIQTTAFWCLTPCSFVYWGQHFSEACCFLLQSKRPITSLLTPAIFLTTLIVTAYIVTLKKEGKDFSETLVSIYEITMFYLKRMLIKEVRSGSMKLQCSIWKDAYKRGTKLLYEITMFYLKRMLIKEVRSCSMNRKTTAEDSKKTNRIV